VPGGTAPEQSGVNRHFNLLRENILCTETMVKCSVIFAVHTKHRYKKMQPFYVYRIQFNLALFIRLRSNCIYLYILLVTVQ
jgi:hypothetical protein